MRTIAISAAVATTLLVAAAPARAQLDIQQLLQGLTTGNQRDDQSLRDAFQRGYDRGRQDEARAQRQRDDRTGNNRPGDDRTWDDRDRDDRSGRRVEPRYPRDIDRR